MAKNNRLLWTQKIVEAKVTSNSTKKPSSRRAWTEEAIKSKATAGQKRKIADIERNLIGTQIRGVVLGIDPSLRGTGLAAIFSEADKSLSYIESKTIRNAPSLSMPECLARIFEETTAMIKRTNPVCVAIEQSVYVQNFRTAITLGAARGAAIAAVAHAGLEVFEYPPLRIKQAVIGYGRASKEQIASSVAGLVKGANLLPFDEADASGAAIAHIFTHKI